MAREGNRYKKKHVKKLEQSRLKREPEMWMLIQEPRAGWSEKMVCSISSPSLLFAGGAIRTYEDGVACWALLPGSSLLVGREGGDIETQIHGWTPDIDIDIDIAIDTHIQGWPGDTSLTRGKHATISIGENVQGGKPEVGLFNGNMDFSFLLRNQF